jgi:folate-binding Fe-S cluster repair protein YgfZ
MTTGPTTTTAAAATGIKELDPLHQGHRFAKVPHRQLLEMEGPDASKFLQGLITNHMPLISAGGDGFYTAFLTPQVKNKVEVLDSLEIFKRTCILCLGA